MLRADQQPRKNLPKSAMTKTSVIVVGASWGGLAAVTRVISDLPADFDVPIVIVQHRSRHADNLLAGLLQDATTLSVVDVEDKEALLPGGVYIAPANYHMLIDDGH